MSALTVTDQKHNHGESLYELSMKSSKILWKLIVMTKDVNEVLFDDEEEIVHDGL